MRSELICIYRCLMKPFLTSIALLVSFTACLSEADLSSRLGDVDGDGVKVCGPQSNPVLCDCDDNNPEIYPAHGSVPAPAEVCDSIDNNCDGTADEGLPVFLYYPDLDKDTYGVVDSNDDGTPDTQYACTQPAGYALNGDDCKDDDADYFPGSPKETCDGINKDYNCDGSVGNADVDGDKSPACADCNDTDSERWPGRQESCDGKDNDCDGAIDEDVSDQAFFQDSDGDGYGNPNTITQVPSCTLEGFVLNGKDCNDQDIEVNPDILELCNNIDDNCNGQVDEGLEGELLYDDADGDGFGNPAKPADACTAPPGYVDNDDDCDDQDKAINPAAPPEACTATVDQNCDGSVGDEDADRDGTRACQDCDDTDPTTYPGAPEKCDSKDNNCDNVVDNMATDQEFFRDSDYDGYGNAEVKKSSKGCALSGYVTNASDCDDSRSSVHPDADEICDGHDSNCDGTLPAIETDSDGDSFRGCAEGQRPPDCNDDPASGGSLQSPGLVESCDGIDNNCNTLVDEDVQLNFYADEDGDGFGDEDTAPTLACSVPSGMVSNATDCDDLNNTINPDATETCDGIDNNCDDHIDEDLLFTAYPDVDGDGFGDANKDPVSVCAVPPGTVANGDDCDDDDANANPLQPEVLGNSIDDNCNGEVDEAFSWLYLDADGDGYGYGENPDDAEYVETGSTGYSHLSTDCQDSDPTIYPGAIEFCDAEDNDCDGEDDEGVTTLFYSDSDDDGFGSSDAFVSACIAPAGTSALAGDCDDADEDTFPGADETCDQDDNNCDGIVDEDAIDATEFYVDADLDDYGDIDGQPTYVCENPTDTKTVYVDNDGDCNDHDDDIHPDALEVCDGIDTDCDGNPDNDISGAKTWHPDADQDGYGDAYHSLQSCASPTLEDLTWILDGSDCNDTLAAVKPGATELCNGVDDDCNGTIDDGQTNSRFFRDADGDGFGTSTDSAQACVAPLGYVTTQGDCNDTNALIYPGAKESCDSLDNDCDSQIDEGLLKTFYKDGDGDGYGDPQQSRLACPTPSGWVSNGSDCNDGNPNVNPSRPEVCDGIDNNCNTQIDEGVSSTFYQDSDQDGHGNPGVTISACSSPDGYILSPADDCNDGDSSIYPGAVEVCDKKDNNCNITVDEGVTTTFYRDADGDGYGSSSVTIQACPPPPPGYVSNKSDCNDGDEDIHPGALEECNSQDDDCNGQVDESLPLLTYYLDSDGDGYGGTTLLQSCQKSAPTGYSEAAGDCNDADNAVHPDAAEACNGKDDNCDGAVDEGLSSLTWYKDGDADGFGLTSQTQQACTQPTGFANKGGDCLDTDKNTFPGAAEKESTTACMTDVDTDGYGAKSPVTGVAAGTDCVDTDKAVNPVATEVCNGKDDDCDGFMDAADPGTLCTELCEVDDSYTTTDTTHYKQIKDALRNSACKDILVYPGTYIPFIVGKAGPLTIHSSAGPAQTVIDAAKVGAAVTLQNGSNVVIGNDVLLEGFTIKNGSGLTIDLDGNGTSETAGGGIYVGAGAAPTLKNLTVINSSAQYGGGIFIDGTCSTCTKSPVLEDITVGGSGTGEGNSAKDAGGGLDIHNIPSTRPLKVKGSVLRVEKNKAACGSGTPFGGGIRLVSSMVEVTAARLELVSNYASSSECHNGAGQGGGLYAYGSTLKLINSDLQVIGNYAVQYFGGIVLYGSALVLDSTSSGLFQSNSTSNNEGGALGIWDNSTATLNNLTFDKNSTGRHGGAIAHYNSPSLTLNNVTFTGNKSGGVGGAIYSNGSVSMSDTEIAGNSAGDRGGAIYADGDVKMSDSPFTSNTTSSSGGAIYALGTITLLTDTTLQNNTAGASGGALYSGSNISAPNVTLTLLGNKANNGPGGAIYAGGSLTASRVLVGNNQATVASGSTGATCAGIRMSGGSIKEALFWNNKATNGTGGILCLDGSGGVVESAIFSGNQISSGQARGGSLLLSGSGHKVQNVTVAYTENLLKTTNVAEVFNSSSGLMFNKNVLVADTADLYLDYGISSSSAVSNITSNVLYFYGSACGGTPGGCGDESTVPLFLSTTDDNKICDEDYHLSNSTLTGYGAYGLDDDWDESLPAIPECE